MQSGGTSSNFDRVCTCWSCSRPIASSRGFHPRCLNQTHSLNEPLCFTPDRAHFSAINPSDIQKAYKALGKPDKNQALSVDARQELDLKVGVAFSRFQTRYFQGRYGDLDRCVR